MQKALSVLIVEDSESDGQMVVRLLKKAGYDVTSEQVDTATQMRAALEKRAWDIIISDYSMPQFSGPAALAVMQEMELDIPFIVVSGTMGEDAAVAMMKAGAHDYLMKGGLSRLAPAVERELVQAVERRERRKAEEALREKEHLLSESQRIAHIGSWVYDEEGRITWSDETYRVYGVTLDTFVPDAASFLNLVHPDDRPAMQAWIRACMAGEKPGGLEFRAVLPDGTIRFINGHGELTSDAVGRRYLSGTAQDITERKRAMAAVRESELRFRSVWEKSADGMRLTNREGRILDVNDAFCKLVRLPREELLGQVLSIVYQREGPDDDLSLYQRRFDAGETISNLLGSATLRSGEAVHLEVTSSFIETTGHERMLLSLFRNVTEREQAALALRTSEEKFRGIFENVQDVFYEASLDGTIIEVSPSIETMSKGQYHRNDLIGRPMSEFYADAGQRQVLLSTLQERGSVSDFEITLKNRDGSLIPCSISSKIWFDAQGHPKSIMGSMRDASGRKRAEEDLRMQSAALNAAANAIVITDAEGNLQWANQAFNNLTGYQPVEAIGKNSRDLVKSGRHDRLFYKQLWDTVLAGKIWTGEMINRRKDGTLYAEEQTITPLLDASGKVHHFIAIKQDISNRKLLEDQVRQMQKLEGLGTLASGIAHDFNNILGIVLGHLALLERTRENEGQFKQSISSIQKAVERGASLVRQILTFARRSETQLEPVNINAAIKELAKMLDETFPKTISISHQLEKAVPVISMDPTHLHQTLLNLCVNARDAMDGRGDLTIETALVRGALLTGRFPNASANHYVKVSVTDTGSGMDEETKRRIFEPFFTTKEVGKGTGLGLAVVYGVIQSHNGFIEVESAPGVGTTFNLFFPIPEGILAPDRPRPERTEELPGGNETILVVEDEPILREVLAKFLETAGYTVIPSSDGEEAVTLYGARKDDIDLVISDMGLPKRNGWEAFKVMQKVNPAIRALLASGYLEPGQRSEILKSGIRNILNKPYHMEEILKAIRETLDEGKNQV